MPNKKKRGGNDNYLDGPPPGGDGSNQATWNDNSDESHNPYDDDFGLPQPGDGSDQATWNNSSDESHNPYDDDFGLPQPGDGSDQATWNNSSDESPYNDDLPPSYDDSEEKFKKMLKAKGIKRSGSFRSGFDYYKDGKKVDHYLDDNGDEVPLNGGSSRRRRKQIGKKSARKPRHRKNIGNKSARKNLRKRGGKSRRRNHKK